jgi:GDPmannose 4,6-dehydratase
VSKEFFRPSEVELLLGDPSSAEKNMKWKRRISFKELVSEMVSYDIKEASI